MYKRQALRRKARSGISAEHGLSFDPKPASGRNRYIGASSVSYTHLDVYKRQQPQPFTMKDYIEKIGLVDEILKTGMEINV